MVHWKAQDRLVLEAKGRDYTEVFAVTMETENNCLMFC
jgi:hypothetical protein